MSITTYSSGGLLTNTNYYSIAFNNNNLYISIFNKKKAFDFLAFF